MATVPTPVQGLPVPDNNTEIRKLYQAIIDLGEDVELRISMRFASMTELATKLAGVTLVAGMEAWISDSKVKMIYDGTTWHQMWPMKPAIMSGTSTPAANVGNVGDIYFQL